MSLNCGLCTQKNCYNGLDCAGLAGEAEGLIRNPENYHIMKAAARVESAFYMKKTRVEEIIEFSRLMNYNHLGIAFCIGLADEARTAVEIFGGHFKITSACCKVCGISKESLGFDKLNDSPNEVTCNPAAQAMLMNRAGTQLNIIIGLCIGHDMVFTKQSKAPVTTLVAKDRVLAHNPAGALYSGYYKKILIPDK